MSGQEHFYLETNAALAYFDEGGQLLIHSSTQHPSPRPRRSRRTCWA